MELVPVGIPCDGSACASRAISRTFPVRHCWAFSPCTKWRYSSSLPVSAFNTALRTYFPSRCLVGRQFRVPWRFRKGRCCSVTVFGLLVSVGAAIGDRLGVGARACLDFAGVRCWGFWLGFWVLLVLWWNHRSPWDGEL